MNAEKRFKGWLLPAAMILFFLLILTFPFTLGNSWADRSQSPEHMLVYTTGRLYWDRLTTVKDGVAEFSLFESSYDNVLADNGDKLAAPGTGKTTVIRLKNGYEGPISYTAVLYRIADDPEMAVQTSLLGKYTEAKKYKLPEGVEPEQVVQAVKGTVEGESFHDFDLNWTWAYDNGPEQDLIDSAVGDRASLGLDTDVRVGLFVVVEDDNPRYGPVLILPESDPSPNTGHMSNLLPFAVLIGIGAVVLVLLLSERRKDRR